MTHVDTLLVPVDFSHSSRVALRYARDLARRLDASVHVLHVVDDSAGVMALGGPLVDRTLLMRERRCKARMHMNALLNGLPAQRMTDEIATGPVAGTIARAAVDAGAAMIVMGTHGRAGLAHMLLGSVAEDVIRAARCPVVTVRDDAALATAVAV